MQDSFLFSAWLNDSQLFRQNADFRFPIIPCHDTIELKHHIPRQGRKVLDFNTERRELMEKNIEQLRTQFINCPPLGLTAEEIREMTEEELLDLAFFAEQVEEILSLHRRACEDGLDADQLLLASGAGSSSEEANGSGAADFSDLNRSDAGDSDAGGSDACDSDTGGSNTCDLDTGDSKALTPD